MLRYFILSNFTSLILVKYNWDFLFFTVLPLSVNKDDINKLGGTNWEKKQCVSDLVHAITLNVQIWSSTRLGCCTGHLCACWHRDCIGTQCVTCIWMEWWFATSSQRWVRRTRSKDAVEFTVFAGRERLNCFARPAIHVNCSLCGEPVICRYSRR